MTSTSNTNSLQKTVYFQAKNHIYLSPLFLEILQIYYKLVILGVWACPPKAAQICKKLTFIWQKKSTWSINFLGILHFKESWNLIGQKQLGKQLQNKTFARHEVCNGKTRIARNSILHCCLEKQMKKFSKKQNTLFWSSFFPNLGKNEFSTSCQKSENYGANSEKDF